MGDVNSIALPVSRWQHRPLSHPIPFAPDRLPIAPTLIFEGPAFISDTASRSDLDGPADVLSKSDEHKSVPPPPISKGGLFFAGRDS